MQLECAVCHTPLRAEDVRFDPALVKCHACNAIIYDLSRRKARGRAKAAIPTYIQVEENEQRTVLSWRWFKARIHLSMFFFCLIWDGGLLLTVQNPIISKGQPLSALLVPLMFVGASVILTYSTLAGFLNTTRIEVNRSELTIHHGPLPWPGSRTLPGRELTQLYGQKVRGNRWSLTQAYMTYSLFALDKQGRKVELLSGLDDKNQVLYLEQELERQLGIEDSSVDGELAQRNDVA